MKDGITFAVSDTGNTTALCMCIASVLNSRAVPHRIQILCQGDFPSFNNFYLEQLAEWARMSGIEFSLTVSMPLGLRGARDWHFDNCPTRYLWMGDNDVVYAPDCLEMLSRGWDKSYEGKQVYVQGVKSDINNRRGYPDFVSECQPLTALKDFCSANFRYQQLSQIGMKGTLPTFDTATIDTGNVLFDMYGINLRSENKFRFNVFDDSLNCGGEDTLMSLLLRKYGLVGRFMPWAVSYHLEKPQSAFSELTARGEMLLRACDQLGLDKDLLKKGFAPWVFTEYENHQKNQQEGSQENRVASVEEIQASTRISGVHGNDPQEARQRRQAQKQHGQA
jgi:hypothetical protein